MLVSNDDTKTFEFGLRFYFLVFQFYTFSCLFRAVD